MKITIVAMALFASASAVACKPGFVPSDTPGVCVEKTGGETNPSWVSDEKPPKDKMPSYQREGISLVNCPSTAKQDEESDKAIKDATAEGKKSAGIK